MVVLASLMAAVGPLSAQEEGLALRPAVVLLQNVEPGRPFSLVEESGRGFTLTNRSSETMAVSASVRPPAPEQMMQFEYGYVPPPQADWFRLEPADATIASGQSQQFDLQVTLPADDAWGNRHWMLYVECGPSEAVAMGATVRLRARVLLETAVVKQADEGAPPAVLSVDPSVVAMRSESDGSWSGGIRIGNGDDRVVHCDLLGVPQVFGQRTDRVLRYFPNPPEAVLDNWSVADRQELDLAPGAWQEILWRAEGRETSLPREEIVLIGRRATMPSDLPTVTIGDRSYDRWQFVRLVYRGQR